MSFERAYAVVALADQVISLRKDRDELLAALRVAVASGKDWCDEYGCYTPGYCRALIARIEGGK